MRSSCAPRSQHAGAERGLLILSGGATEQIAAQATSAGDTVFVRVQQEPLDGSSLPESVVLYVLRTQERVILDDASTENPFSADPYIRQVRPRSVLCLPFLNQNRLAGVLYLENNLAACVFTPSRVWVLQLLTSQAAISIENARLYRDLAERERRIRCLVARQDSEERWRAVFEYNPTKYFILDKGGIIVSVNPFGAERLGYTVDELVGRPILDIVHQADRVTVARNAASCFDQLGRPMSWEARKVRKDTSVIWVRETALATLIKGQPVLLLASQDITEQKTIEHLTQQWFESSPNIMAIIGRDYRYVRANQEHARYWGVSSDRIVGMHVAELRGWKIFHEIVKPRLDRCFTGDEPSYRYTGWWDTPTGRRCYMATYTPLRPQSEQVEAVLIINSDITEYELAAEALRQTQAELAHMNRVTTMGQLTAAIAHEVNQPITAALTNAQAALRWLRARPPELGEVRDALERIAAAGNRAGEVIGRIRALIKKAPARTEPLDINKVISDVIAVTGDEVRRNGIALLTQLRSDLPLLRGDPVQLAQVILNFVLNAIDAMRGEPEGPRELLIETEIDESGDVLVAVRDSGPGLSGEVGDRLFEPFFTTKPSGMGMGLSICRSIIEAHGGRVWASANLPRGAAFLFTLPA